MIITRTPLRISIGGGGTDLPSYYENHGGFVISAAINKYIYILLNKMQKQGYFIKYSMIEEVQNINEISHPIIREALALHNISNIEIVSVADIMSGTGLGSSSSFTVGLLHALNAINHKPMSSELLAREAIDLEMIKLKEPIGKQDQYIASYGGIICQEYHKNGDVTIAPLNITEKTRLDLADGLMLFFTGISRSASSILIDQKKKSEENNQDMINNLHHIKDLGMRIKTALEEGLVDDFGKFMHEHWEMKRKRSKGMSDLFIDNAYQHALNNGAIGGKMVGAGGGGFLMFYTRDRIRLRNAMLELNLKEMPFSFDSYGSIIQLHE